MDNTVKTTKQTALLRKFSQNGTGVLTARARNLEQQVLNELKMQITQLEQKRLNKESQLQNLTDVAPESTTSQTVTLPGNRTAEQFVRDVLSLQEEIVEIDIKLTIAKNQLDEWSAEE